MNDIPVADTRTLALMGHTGNGKTTLIDALLLKLGLNDRLGSVAAGSSMADYTDEEKGRRISIFAKPFTATYKSASGKPVNLVFVDTPGYQDFQGQQIAASRAVESVVIAVDAVAGVQVGTRRAWKLAEKQGLARAFVVTGLDRENAGFDKALEGIRAAFGDGCVPVVLPLPGNGGVLDVLAAKDVPSSVSASAEEYKGKLVELAAETNDALIEKFLGGEALSADEIAVGLRDAVRKGGLTPVFACLALKDQGIVEFLEGVRRLLPSPADMPATDAAGAPVESAPDKPFVGFVWRTVNDPFVGQLAFVRVLGGTLRSDSEIYNVTKGQKERIGAMSVVNGKKQSAVPGATAGDIVAIPKLKNTGGNDTLGAPGATVQMPKMAFPSPVMFQSVTAKTQADEDKIGTALSRVCDEDPTLKFEQNRETKEMVIMGLGDVHLDVAVELMKNRSNVSVTLNTPKVPYRETVTSRGEGHYKHKKQSGGRGQYGEVYLRIEPRPPSETEWFVDAIVGGAIPNNFVPAVQKGLVEGMLRGTIAGYPVSDVRVTLYDGSYHEVDSSEIAFKIAAARGFKEAMAAAKPVLLEPIMTVKVMIPDAYMGPINGDLNHKRGRILGMEQGDGTQTVTAEVPQAELFRYAAELRSMTGGQGSFEMEFCRYDIVPSNIAQKVIAAAAKQKEEEEE
jgi:elongation factor G